MKEYFFSHKKTLFVILGVLLLLVLITTLFIAMQKPKVPQNTVFVDPETGKRVTIFHVVSVSPKPEYILSQGSRPVFTFAFDRTIAENIIRLKIQSKSISSNKILSVNFTQDISSDGKNLTVSLENPIAPATKYTFTIINLVDNKAVSKVSFASNEPLPTAVPSNNPALQDYLPYKTNNYELDYLASRNLYVFHFIFNPQSTLTLKQQYDKAVGEAKLFIKSKGIDPASITIEWRYN